MYFWPRLPSVKTGGKKQFFLHVSVFRGLDSIREVWDSAVSTSVGRGHAIPGQPWALGFQPYNCSQSQVRKETSPKLQVPISLHTSAQIPNEGQFRRLKPWQCIAGVGKPVHRQTLAFRAPPPSWDSRWFHYADSC